MTIRRHGVTTTIAVAMFIVGLLIGLVGMYVAAPSILGSTSSTSSGLHGTVTIGDLVSITGDLSSQGARDKAAVDMAISDINTWLAATGQNLNFAVDHEDSATDTNVVLQKMQTLASKGIQVFVGPEWSGGANALLSYANQNHLVMISESSTSPLLAIANDNLFRLVPSDDAQGKALAVVQNQLGIQAIAVLHRNDAYGNGLAKADEDTFKALGGSVLVDQQYDPTSSDYSTQLTAIKAQVDSAVSSKGASHVAVELVSFDEGGVILQQAQSSYSSLLNVRWFGCDGEAQLDPFVTTASAPSLKVKLISTLYQPAASAKYEAFVTRFTQTSGLSIQSYAASAYDCAWVAALSLIAAGKNDGGIVAKVLPTVANNYFGVSGWTNLNSFGDLSPIGYDVWAVEPLSNGTANWAHLGSWDAATNTATLTSQP
jgi:branched-chain amino acid transport system substrate-binding protein